MVVFLLVIFVICALLLNLLILIQDDQGEGIGSLFGGGGSGAMGSRKGNVLTKVTSVLATIFIVTALAAAWLNRSVSADDLEAKARVKQLEQQGSNDWFVDTSAETQTEAEESEASTDENQSGSLTTTSDQSE